MLKSIFFTLATLAALPAYCQTSGATGMTANAVPHTTVPFRISDPGTKLPDITWGLDCAWISEGNIRRGVNFAGEDLIDIIRLSFQTTDAVGEDLQLSASQKATLDTRIRLAKMAGKVTVNINSDQEAGVIDHYQNTSLATNATRWYLLIKATKNYIESKGLKVSSVSPFNEPDYAPWKQGTKQQFQLIAKMIKEDPDFSGVAVCGGNTLNDDQALGWYTACKKYLDEGNTHQLAGSFDNFARFYQQVKADGKVGVGDELHNTMECLVGSEYGLTKGIWWGTCDHTRSQFMKASRGTRLGYAENRGNWTAASVYRHPDGHVEGFGGSSERQAATTLFRMAATDHDVFYNGMGPTREYLMNIPGGTGYQTGQTNAETMVCIQDGEDIMPPLPTAATTYKIVNRFSGLVLTVANNSTSNGDLVQNRNQASSKAQKWTVTPMDERSGGDFSYYKISNFLNPRLLLDVLNWSLDDGGGLIGYEGGLGDNEQWFFEYAGEGWFYIRSRHSGLCIQVTPGTEIQQRASGRKLCQGVVNGSAIQQWRLVPDGVVYNNVAPAVPTNLEATGQTASVKLTWEAPADRDLSHYIVQRSTDGQTWNTIHASVPTCEYIDNTAADGCTYYYRVQAVDASLNRSEPSDVAPSSGASNTPELICHLDKDLFDQTINGNHAAIYDDLSWTDGKWDKAVQLDGSTQFIQLPATLANHDALTLALWVNWRGGNTWQRILDFGNDTDHYFFFTPQCGSGARLAIKNGGSEEQLNLGSTFPKDEWTHLAISISREAIVVYLNGEKAAESTTISARPGEFSPIFNYIGRSQFVADPMLKADIEDFRVYNYALSAEEIKALQNKPVGIAPVVTEAADGLESIYDLSGRQIKQRPLRKGIYLKGGRKVRIQ